MWKFDGHDVRRLRRAIKDAKQGRYCRRLMTVLLVAQGHRPGKVARLTGQARRTVSLLLGRYAKRRRPSDLADRPRKGRPRATPALTASRLKREYGHDPLALGYMATEWTVPLLAGHLCRQCGLPVTSRTLRRRMKALGLVWKRPRYVYHPADPHRPQKKGRWFAA
ncbi:MAG TPA: winged helix-turn-helix domain-containing protein [Phycisphaerae bacterium]|nr:winged helix-turn-helix domain-containing protein [Phycisphaerae bacterium]